MVSMKNNTSIFKKILMPVVILVCILMISVMGIMWFSMSADSKKRIAKNNAEATNLIASDISVFLSEAYAVSEELAVNPSILTMDTKIQTPILEDCVERNDYFELLYIQGSDGMQTGRSSGELADRSTRWWFEQTMEEKQPFISKSYYSVNTNMPCASIFIPMVRNNDIIGIMASDIKLDYLVNLVKDVSDNGRTTFIIDGEGTVVAHPNGKYVEELYNYKTLKKTVSQRDSEGNVVKDSEGNIVTQEENLKISKDFEKSVQQVMAGNKGSKLITYNGKKYFISYSPIELDGKSDSWSVVTLQSYSSAMASTVKMLLILIIISVIILGVTIFIMAAVIKRISNPVVELSDIVSEASEGNFTIKMNDNPCRELSLLSKSFNHLLEKMSGILSSIIEVISGVETSKENLDSISEKAQKVVKEVQEISNGATQQEEDVHRVADLTGEARQQCEKLLGYSNKIMDEAQNISDMCSGGSVQISDMDEHNKFFLKEVENSYNKIMQLNVFSEQVGTIVAQINEISDQTSLLALNASIEAARAGEQGKGFAVVADEIGKLSISTKESTEIVADIIKKLQSEVSETVAVVSNIKKSFEKQAFTVEIVKNSFARFDASSGVTRNSIHDMIGMLDDMNRMNDLVVKSVNNIYKISKTVSEKTGVVSEIVAMQQSEISYAANKISDIYNASEILSNDMSKFKIDND